ncbi:MAG: uridine diphosphate-N-acetylglucosamine-binding protein YvcK [Pseudohongiellaceae bacterium]
MRQAVETTPQQDSWFPGRDTCLRHRIVALGGGTGLATTLRGLRPLCFPTDADTTVLTSADKERLTAIVTVADDGGSSGALRRAYSILAPGDIRNCLLALANSDSTLQDLFRFRFNGEVGGHSLGNLILTALSEMECDFTTAVHRAGKMLGVCGRVLPATADDVVIQAEFTDGSRLRGESRIAEARRQIQKISLLPSWIGSLPEACDAIDEADIIVIGPGSLYTSLIPTLLVPGIADAIARSSARVILVMNLMTEVGETDGYCPADFLRAINRHVPQMPVHYVLVNSTPIPGQLLSRYSVDGARPIIADSRRISETGCIPVFCDLLAKRRKVRHDPAKLTRAIFELAP